MLRKRKKKDNFEVYKANAILSIPKINNNDDEDVEKLMKEFHEVFRVIYPSASDQKEK